MKSVYILWQDKSHSGRMWHPVAKLIQCESGAYSLTYTQGAKNPRFQPFSRMSDKNKAYSSDELFAFLKNRIPPSSRPEHEDLFRWCDLESSANYLDLLSVSGGEKVTDNYRVISLPERKNNQYINTFFVSGIRYLSDDQKKIIEAFPHNHQLDYKFEDDNINDPQAVLLLDKDQELKIGYYPKYLTNDLRKLDRLAAESIKIEVVRVNETAPEQFKLLCRTISDWPLHFSPCDDLDFQDYKEALD